MSLSYGEACELEAATSASHDALKPSDWACAAGLALCVLFVCLYANTLLHRERVGSTDFLQEWTSVRNWLSGRPIYAPLHTTLPIYFGPQARSVVDLNAHPPTAVALAIPFCLLPYQDAWLWWNIANLAAIAGSLWLLLGKGGLRCGLGGWTLALLLVLTSNALKEQVQLGQLNGWLLLLITLSWRADRGHQPWASGACIGIAAAIKLFPGFVIFYFLARRNWKACLSAAAAFAILSLATNLLLGWQTYHDYVAQVVPTLDQFRTAWLNASLHAFWSKLLVGRPDRMVPFVNAPPLAQAAIALSCLAVVAGVVWLAGAARSRRCRDIAFAATTVAMLLVCPITWDHYFLLVVPAIAILWRSQQNSSTFRATLVGLVFTLLTIRPGWIFGLAIPGRGEFAEFLNQQPTLVQPSQTITALAYQFYAASAILGLAIYAGIAGLRPRPNTDSNERCA